ncbi:MAG: HAD-IA family hydrolase [Devosia sp.]
MPAKPGAALLFDIDGTLADTDHLHLQAFNIVFGPLGQSFDRARFKVELQGFANSDIAARLLPDLPAPRQMQIMQQKELTFRELAATGLEPMPGLLDLLDAADAEGLPMAAVTNAPRANAELILDGIGIRHRFGAIVIADELDHGKPHPLPYLEGLRRLGAAAELTVAFEDSISGVSSATAATILTIGVLSSLTDKQLIDAGATATVSRYDEPALLSRIATITGAGIVRTG